MEINISGLQQKAPERFKKIYAEENAQKELFPVDESIRQKEVCNRTAERLQKELERRCCR